VLRAQVIANRDGHASDAEQGVATEVGHAANALLRDLQRRAQCFEEEGSALLMWGLRDTYVDVHWHVVAIAAKLDRWRSTTKPVQ
jgi:hypothetical protein